MSARFTGRSVDRPHARSLTGSIRVYTAFFDDLERRIKQGENPECFARSMSDLASRNGFDSAQAYFAGETVKLQLDSRSSFDSGNF